MAYTFEQLSEMTVSQLREIAQGIEHDAVKGFSTMHKEKLLPALCQAMGIEAHKHHTVVGINKGQIKLQIRATKKKREVGHLGVGIFGGPRATCSPTSAMGAAIGHMAARVAGRNTGERGQRRGDDPAI